MTQKRIHVTRDTMLTLLDVARGVDTMPRDNPDWTIEFQCIRMSYGVARDIRTFAWASEAEKAKAAAQVFAEAEDDISQELEKHGIQPLRVEITPENEQKIEVCYKATPKDHILKPE